MNNLLRIVAALVWACLLPAALAQPVINAAVNAASNEALLAPGCWMSIYGTNLSPETNQAAAVPLPHSLSGVSVSLDGIAAPLLFVSTGQINALVPFDIQLSSGDKISADVVVTTPQGTSAPHPVFVTDVAPALYTRDMTGKGPAIVLTPGFQLLDSVAPGDTVVVYAAGLGQTDPPAQSDSGGASEEPYNRVPESAMLEVWVGDQRAEVLFAGLAPGFPGVYQLNLRLHEALSSDRVMLRMGLVQSNVAQAPIAGGQNVANVSGAITGLFPSDATNPNFPAGLKQSASLMPQAMQFSVSLDILPGAGPFTILAAGESGTALIAVDPVQGTWQATNTVPDPLVRYGDFSHLMPIILLDYLGCWVSDSGDLTCIPYVANRMPMSRMDPAMMHAMSFLPQPTYGSGGGIGVVNSSGTLPAGGHFVIDDQNNSAAGLFGGIANIPLGYLDTRIAPLRLYVDGKLIASQDVSYKVATRPN